MYSTLPGDATLDYPLFYAFRYYNRLSNLPTVHSDQYGDTTNENLLCSTLSRNTITDYPIYRLSTVIYMVMLQPTICGGQLCIAILQPTIQITDYPLQSVWRYYKRLSAALYCVSRYCNRLNTMSGVTTTGYSLCSTCRYYNRLSAALYCNRVSAVLYYVWRYYNWLSALLYLSRLQEEQMTCAQENFHDFYSRVSYTCRYTKRRSNLPTLRYDLYCDTTTDFLWYLPLSRRTTTD
jgi:hypothetical protein